MKIFFPPRLIDTDDTIEDSNARLDEACEQYKAQGVAILLGEESVKDAMKVIEFAGAFDDLVSPIDELI